MREGHHSTATEPGQRTLADLIDRYVREVLPGKEPWAQADQTRQLAWWRAELGAHPLSSLTHFIINDTVRDKLKVGNTSRGKVRTPATVNRYLAALSVVYSAAVKEWGWADANPVLNVKKPKELLGKPRYLLCEPPNDELGRLLRACQDSDSPDLYCAVVLSLCTGGRWSEIMGLRWSQVSFTRRSIILEDTKNGESRALPLEAPAFDLMRERAKDRHARMDTDLVFPAHHTAQPILLRKPFATALRRAGIENFRWHDLRHTAASYMAQKGKSLLAIKDFLGHKTLDMVLRYAHLSPSSNQEAVKDMNAHFFGAGSL